MLYACKWTCKNLSEFPNEKEAAALATPVHTLLSVFIFFNKQGCLPVVSPTFLFASITDISSCTVYVNWLYGHSLWPHVYLLPSVTTADTLTNSCQNVVCTGTDLSSPTSSHFGSFWFLFFLGACRQSVSVRTTLPPLWWTKIILPCSSWNGY